MSQVVRLTRNQRLLTYAVLVLSVFVGTFLRLRGLGDAGLWLDETYTIEHASKPLLQIAESLRKGGAHPPLFFVLMHLALYVGDNEWIVRLPVAMMGIAIIPLLYVLGYRIFGRVVGLCAALLLAVSPFQIHFSREARMYPLLALLSLLSLYALWRALEENETHWWAVFTVATVLNLYTHYFALLATGGTLLFAAVVLGHDWLAYKKRKAQRMVFNLLLCCLVVVLLYVPWLPTMQVNFFQRQANKVVQLKASKMTLNRALLDQVLLDFGGGAKTMAGLVEWMSILGLVSIILCTRWKALTLISSWFLPPLFAIAVFGPRKFDPRYVAYLQPLYVMLTASGLEAAATGVAKLVKPTVERRYPYVTIMVLGTICLGLVSVGANGQSRSWQKEDWKAISGYLQENLKAGDVIIADGVTYLGWGDSNRVIRMMSWYGLDSRGTPVLKEIDVARKMETLANQQGQVWAVIFCGPYQLHEDPSVAQTYFKPVVIAHLHRSSSLLTDNIIQMLEAMIRVLPHDDAKFDLHLALAEIYRAAGQSEQVREHIEQALKVKPVRFDPSSPRAEAYRRLGLDQQE